MSTINLNENKNQLEVSEERMKELKILKIISVVISDDGETLYRVVTEDGETKFIPASEILIN